MVRWLERNGYDVSYSTGVDSDRRGAEIREHRAFLSVGHDEYWSSGQRDHVEAARDAGVHLAFFSGNEVFWKTRWENGHRTLVCYKETHAGAKIDPTTTWTGTWRDPRGFNPEGPQPENSLTGTLFRVNSDTRALEVPAADGRLRFWRGTNLASQAAGATAVLPHGTLGYEWDEAPADGARPAGLVQLSTTFAGIAPVLQDHGSIYAPGPATHHLTLYRDTNGAGPDALVFGAGTIQWSWGLDGYHVRGSEPPNAAMQQATANQLADMGVHARSLQAGLNRPAASTDIFAPTAAISGPATFSVSAGESQTIAGSAADRGGGRVGAVEVSTDGGLSWRPASGRERWSYTWTPPVGGVGDAARARRGRQRPSHRHHPGPVRPVDAARRRRRRRPARGRRPPDAAGRRARSARHPRPEAGADVAQGHRPPARRVPARRTGVPRDAAVEAARALDRSQDADLGWR